MFRKRADIRDDRALLNRTICHLLGLLGLFGLPLFFGDGTDILRHLYVIGLDLFAGEGAGSVTGRGTRMGILIFSFPENSFGGVQRGHE